MSQEIQISPLRILAVDDYDVHLRLLYLQLDSLGHRAITYQRPIAALNYFLKQPNSIDILYTDYLMPVMNGLELAKRIRDRAPRLPIILSSSYHMDEIQQADHEKVIDIWLPKPYGYKDLKIALTEAASLRETRNLGEI